MANLTGFRMPMEGSKAQFRMPGTVDPTKKYLNQPYSGMNLRTHTASAKLKYDPSDSWHFEGGYQVVKSYKGYVYSVNNTFNDNNGGFRVSRRSSSGVAGQFDVSSWYAMATTSFETASLYYDFVVQANGYEWKTFSPFNKGTTPRGYGDNSSLFSNPAYFLEVSYTKGSNLSLLSKTLVRNLTIADNIELNDRWSVLLSFTNSWINQKNFDNVSGVGKTKDISTNGQSYSANLMYNPLENLMIYTGYLDSLQVGSSYTYSDGRTTTLDPFRSEQYEVGVKTRIADI